MEQQATVDYCVIGHVSRDVVPGGFTVGGTVAYSSRVAQALGLRTGVLTSNSADFDAEAAMPGSDLIIVPADETTTFENIYTPNGRIQKLYGVAGRLGPAHVPAAWRRAPIVHLAPLTNEIDFDILTAFDDTFVGITPQGWMRRWDAAGNVYAVDWDEGRAVLPHADAVVLSIEDLPSESALDFFRAHSPLLVLTMGHDGCTIFRGADVLRVPAPRVEERNLTGAGDVFATAFFVELQRSANVTRAAEFANHIASQSVTQPDLESKVRLIQALQVEW